MLSSPYFWSVLAYLIFLSGIAIYSSRKVKGEADFVLAGRGLSARVLVGTMLASWIGSGTLIAGSEYAFNHGFAAIWSPAGAWLGIIVVAVLAPRVRRLEQFTLPDILELRYNRWAKLLGSITIIIAFTAIVAYQIRGMGIVLNLVAGIEITTARLIVAAFVIGFTALAGLMSISKMDMVNGIVILIGVIIAVPVLYAVGENNDAFIAPVSSKLTWTGGLPWSETLAYFLSTCFLLLGDPQIYQKLFSAKDQREARKAVIGWVVATIVVEVLVVWLAVEAALLNYGKLGAPEIAHPAQTILHAARYAMPLVMGCIFLVVATAIIVSTATSYLLLPATNFTKNVLQRFLWPNMPTGSVVLVSRLLTVVFGVIAYLLIAQFTSVLEMSRYAYTVYGTGITPAVLAAFLWRRVTAAGGIASIILGTGVTVWWEMATQNAGGIPPWGIPTFYPAIVASLAALFIVSLATPAEPQSKWAPFFDPAK